MKPRILICYKNFSKECQITHIGLGVTAQFTAKSLLQYGIQAEALPIFGADDLMLYLDKQGDNPVTHVVICAMWIPTEWLAKLSRRYTNIKFTLNCHSNVGFLQAEPPAIKLFREAIDLETNSSNFFASGNNLRLCEILTDAYGRKIQFLPNLYYLSGYEQIDRPGWTGGPIRIGAFGSLRIYKNFSTAIIAAIEVSFQLRTPVEIWMNSGRDDGTGNVVYRTALEWTRGLSNVTLKHWPWSTWPEFKRHIGTMHILLQPSYTETFNNVTADGIAEGVPSVVSEAIDWCPDSWKAENDDPKDVAETARRLLTDPTAPRKGYQALRKYRQIGYSYWDKFLSRP